MKVRTGFVSNSSSSSFILRGMKLTSDDIIKTLNISKDEIDAFDEDEGEIYEFLYDKLGEYDFSVEMDGNYFGGQDYSTLIVGESIGSLNDGEAVELPDRTPEQDKVLLEKFEVLGFKGTLKTYIQMVSNDNY